MAVLPKNKRPKATIENVFDFLHELGPISRGEILYKQLRFSVSWSEYKGSGVTIELEHPGNMTALNRFKGAIIKELKGNFNGLEPALDKQGFKILKYKGYNYFIDFDVDESEVKFKGAIPAYVHEEGTTYMLNAAL